MTELEFYLLEKISSSSCKSEEYISLCQNGKYDINTTADAIYSLQSQKLIYQPVGTTKYSLTSLGNQAYNSEKEIRKKDASDKCDKRFNRNIAIAGILVPLVIFILGVATEHFGGIVDFFVSLFS